VAQWAGGYSGNTHATRVADAEGALKHAITAIQAQPGIEATDRAKVMWMAERLLSARERMLKARLVALRMRVSPGRAAGPAYRFASPPGETPEAGGRWHPDGVRAALVTTQLPGDFGAGR